MEKNIKFVFEGEYWTY